MLSSRAILGLKPFWNGVGRAQYGIHLLLEYPRILAVQAQPAICWKRKKAAASTASFPPTWN
jgi:hypothetical protein